MGGEGEGVWKKMESRGGKTVFKEGMEVWAQGRADDAQLTESMMTVNALPFDACAATNATLTTHDGKFTRARATCGVLKRTPKRATARGIMPKSDMAAVARETEAVFEIMKKVLQSGDSSVRCEGQGVHDGYLGDESGGDDPVAHELACDDACCSGKVALGPKGPAAATDGDEHEEGKEVVADDEDDRDDDGAREVLVWVNDLGCNGSGCAESHHVVQNNGDEGVDVVGCRYLAPQRRLHVPYGPKHDDDEGQEDEGHEHVVGGAHRLQADQVDGVCECIGNKHDCNLVQRGSKELGVWRSECTCTPTERLGTSCIM